MSLVATQLFFLSFFLELRCDQRHYVHIYVYIYIYIYTHTICVYNVFAVARIVVNSVR